MTQPKTKYRKKVSDERIKKAAIAMIRASVDTLDNNFKMTLIEATKQFNEVDERGRKFLLGMAKAALEADAEVKEGELHLIEIAEILFCKIKNTDMEYNTLEQFNAKWEEIE